MPYSRKEQITRAEATTKISRYCAYQERCHQEVKDKLYSYGLRSDVVDELIVFLITEGYLNEERFAKAFAGGKFRMKRWGRIRIIRALEVKGVSPNCIKAALTEIPEEAYLQSLIFLLKGKVENLAEENVFVKRDKVAKYLIQKGYEPDFVWQQVKAQLPD